MKSTKRQRPAGALPATAKIGVQDTSASRSVSATKPRTGINAIDVDIKAPIPTRSSSVVHAGPAATVSSLAGASRKEVNPYVGFSRAPDKLGALLHAEITEAFEFAQQINHAFTFFGGARIKPDDPFFAEGKVWGEAVALANVAAVRPEIISEAAASGLFSADAIAASSAVALGVGVGSVGAQALATALASIGGASGPDALARALASIQGDRMDPADTRLLMTLTRTGAGPGMMEAVPIGVLDAKQKIMKLLPPEVGEAALKAMKTQGSSIEVPWEPEPTPHIDELRTFAHFLPRRLALTEQAAGFVVFPGGLGTVNEMFEVLRNGRPTVVHSEKFWGNIVDTLKTLWAARGLADDSVVENLAVVDSPAQGLPHLARRAAQLEAAPAPSIERSLQMSADIQRGLATLTKLPTAVTFIGGHKLQSTDPEMPIARELAAKLTTWNIATRSGGDGALLDAVSEGVKSANPDAVVQALLLDHGKLDQVAIAAKAEVCEVVNSTAAHKVLMYENTDAIVALPGGPGTFDEVFELATLMQCDKIPKRPLILVGKAFWQPFLDACETSMLDKNSPLPEAMRRKTISDDDMQLFQVVDDPAEASRLIRKHRAQREVSDS